MVAALDTDGDGSINAEEFFAADTNGDGYLDYSDLLSYVRAREEEIAAAFARLTPRGTRSSAATTPKRDGRTPRCSVPRSKGRGRGSAWR